METLYRRSAARRFYWARLPRTSSDFWTIVEVDGNYINFPGDDLCEVIEASEYWTNVTQYEYYSQPILPPP